MKKENSIEVTKMTKKFNVYSDKANTLKEKMLFWKRGEKEVRTVLNNISLNIKKGDTVALIGTNGSGKSTLLKLMTKIIYPTSGKIETRGKLTSLLELGAGFHPDFSGRENIYFNASIFGMTKAEIDEKLDDIISFSELEEFIDNLLDGDNAVFGNFFHSLGNDVANLGVVVGADGGHLFYFVDVAANFLSLSFDVGYDGCHGFVDTAFEVHRVGTCGNVFKTCVYDGLSQHGGCGCAVAGLVVGFGSHFLNHLGTHVFDAVFEFNLFGHGYAVLGYLGVVGR